MRVPVSRSRMGSGNCRCSQDPPVRSTAQLSGSLASVVIRVPEAEATCRKIASWAWGGAKEPSWVLTPQVESDHLTHTQVEDLVILSLPGPKLLSPAQVPPTSPCSVFLLHCVSLALCQLTFASAACEIVLGKVTRNFLVVNTALSCPTLLDLEQHSASLTSSSSSSLLCSPWFHPISSLTEALLGLLLCIIILPEAVLSSPCNTSSLGNLIHSHKLVNALMLISSIGLLTTHQVIRYFSLSWTGRQRDSSTISLGSDPGSATYSQGVLYRLLSLLSCSFSSGGRDRRAFCRWSDQLYTVSTRKCHFEFILCAKSL